MLSGPAKSVPKSNLGFLPWAEDPTEADADVPKARVLPLSPAHFEAAINFVDDAESGQQMVSLVRQRPIAYVGFDFEYRFSRPGVVMKRHGNKELVWNDPKSVVPLLASFTFTEPDPQLRLYQFVVDVQNTATLQHVQTVLSQPLSFCCHHAPAELHCVWQLGLRAPDTIWDSLVAQRAQLLGRFHARNWAQPSATDEEEAGQAAQSQWEIASRCSLIAVCRRHGIEHPFGDSKGLLQASFLNHQVGEPFVPEQLAYAAADATAAAQIYAKQVDEAVETNALRHLLDIEMPWAITNARMIYDGIYLSPERTHQVHAACLLNVDRLEAELRAEGLQNVNSHPQVEDFLAGKGLLELFNSGGKYSFTDKRLEAAEDRDPAIAKLRQCRRMRKLLSDKLLSNELIGADGRLHPDHRQLGADSTRNSMRWPAVGGVGKALRPLVVPQEKGMGIGEVDLSQIEVGIAAAVYGDQRLIDMFNSGDVYSQMAKKYHRDVLPARALELPDEQFKKQFRKERGTMKVFTLGIIYNVTAVGLSMQLGISKFAAQQKLDAFLNLFPELGAALKQAVEYGQIRGYAELASGLRRYRGRTGPLTNWEVNWLRNTPVQGTAGLIFKKAGNRLYRRLQHYGARLLLPLHDAFVFEAPLPHMTTVAKITHDVMISAVQEYFPELNPHADINIDHPAAWTKDGKHRSLDLWCVHPDHAKLHLNT